MHRLFLCVFMLVSSAANALPIAFTNALYTTSAFAEVGAESAGINAASSPPSALLLSSHASVTGADTSVNEFAHADAIADDGLLVAATEAQGNTRHAGAVAEASFEAELMGAGAYFLGIDFENFTDLSGAEAGAVLGLTLSVGAQTLFDEIFTRSEVITRLLVLAPGELGLLHLSLISHADGFPDALASVGDLYGFNLASASFALRAVPSPSPLALIGAGLLPVLRVARKRRSALRV